MLPLRAHARKAAPCVGGPRCSCCAHARKAAQGSEQADPSQGSGFRLRALAALTLAKRLKEVNKQIPRKARDFACGLPLRSRPQNGSRK